MGIDSATVPQLSRRNEPSNIIVVDASESGQKILSFLQNRLASSPAPMLHKWIRTGQVRRNGRRVRPFERVSAGDMLRLPPFAELAPRLSASGPNGGMLSVIGRCGEILAINKPAGLPVHGGTLHSDSVAARLLRMGGAATFRLAPAHRLDMETSGVLLAATSYRALVCLHNCFSERIVKKHYLAWVEGRFESCGPVVFHDLIGKSRLGDYEKMVISPGAGGASKEGIRWQEASCRVWPVKMEADRTLVHILLETGRKHQIRAQLGHRGFPVVGDTKYGASGRRGGGIFLHSARIVLPDGPAFDALPPWAGDFGVPGPLSRYLAAV